MSTNTIFTQSIDHVVVMAIINKALMAEHVRYFQKMLDFGCELREIEVDGEIPEHGYNREQLISFYPGNFTSLITSSQGVLISLNKLFTNLQMETELTKKAEDIYWAVDIYFEIYDVLQMHQGILDVLYKLIEVDLINNLVFWSIESISTEEIIKQGNSLLKTKAKIAQSTSLLTVMQDEINGILN